jgi:hypothetical protein
MNCLAFGISCPSRPVLPVAVATDIGFVCLENTAQQVATVSRGHASLRRC